VPNLVGRHQRDLTGRSAGDYVVWTDDAGKEHTVRVMLVQSNEPSEPVLWCSRPCREWVRWDSVKPMGRIR
jgi:hypothetical protein